MSACNTQTYPRPRQASPASGVAPDTHSHVMPGMQEEAPAKLDAGPREALAG